MTKPTYKLVPVEPTEEMLKSASNVEPIFGDLYSVRDRACYRAMLAAAPAPAGAKGETDAPFAPGWLEQDVIRAVARVAELDAATPSPADAGARLREALTTIRSMQYDDRSTVSPENAWEAFKKLNSHVCKIYSIADEALSLAASPMPEEGE